MKAWREVVVALITRQWFAFDVAHRDQNQHQYRQCHGKHEGLSWNEFYGGSQERRQPDQEKHPALP